MYPSFFMNEQDLKYMLATYQQRSADLFTQSIAHEAKIRQLTDLVNTLNEKVKEQEKEIEKLSKTKTPRTAKSIKDDSTF